MPSPSPQSIRIAIDGAQSTGKTTLQVKLEAHYGERFDYVPEAARAVATEFGVACAADWQALIDDRTRLAAFFAREEEWLRRAEAEALDCIIDSSLFLIGAYRERFGCPRGVAHRPYDLVLYCGLDVTYTDDGFRFVDGRTEVDRIYRERFASRASHQTVWLPPGEVRYRRAIEAIDLLLRSG